MNNDKILILGSKPNFRIPILDYKKIYSSNASAEIAKKYQSKIKKIPHTCIVGAKNYMKLNEIKNRIINSQPDELVIRSFKEEYKSYLVNNIKQKFLTNKDQINIQKVYFKNGLLDLISAELNYKNKFFRKIQHILKCILNDELLGFSTGVFSALYALNENRNADVILCGIGFEGGQHYYNSGLMTKNRGRVDTELYKKIKKKYCDRIYISDEDINQNIKLNKIEDKKYLTLDEL